MENNFLHMVNKPTLLLEEIQCRKNILAMKQKASENGLEIRPHFKTHQSKEIGRWYKDYGVEKIAVSSMEMAAYFAGDWNDILVAFPANILEINAMNDLAAKAQIHLTIENTEAAEFLNAHLTASVGFFLKIDVGYHRTGIAPGNTPLIDHILQLAKKSSVLNFKGFLAHAGHTYQCRSENEILAVHSGCLVILNKLKKKYLPDFPELIVSYGDTPSCSVAENFSGIDEIRPGNFIFYDLAQYQIGSNSLSQISIAMACPVVAIHSERSEVIIYGGSVHFSKDALDHEDGTKYFGLVAEKNDSGWGNVIPGVYVKKLSQEHGTVAGPPDWIAHCNIGDILLILPVHACLTSNLMKSYLTTTGKSISRL